MDLATLKLKVHQKCSHLAFTKIEGLKSELKSLQEAYNADIKSSVGDKYETGRSMIMLEKEKLIEFFEGLILSKDSNQELSMQVCMHAIMCSMIVAARTHLHARVCVYACIQCVCTCMPTCVHACIHAHMQPCMYARMDGGLDRLVDGGL